MTQKAPTQTDEGLFTRWFRETGRTVKLYQAYRDGHITAQEFQTEAALISREPAEVRGLIALADTYNALRKEP